MRLAVCIKERTERTCKEAMRRAAIKGAGLVELRIDCLTDKKRLGNIVQASPIDVIATCRRKTEGGFFNDREEGGRAQLLKDAVHAGAAMVDVEHDMDANLIRNIRSCAQGRQCKVIVSYHDFCGTPELMSIYSRAKRLGDIIKIATTANNLEDCNKLLHLYEYANGSRDLLLAFAMGEMGRFTRAASLVYGAPFAYCSLEKGGKANGQMAIDEMKSAVKIFMGGQG